MKRANHDFSKVSFAALVIGPIVRETHQWADFGMGIIATVSLLAVAWILDKGADA